MTLDEVRGLVYLPVSTPSNDYYGGNRPGNNLFGESLVCLDAATGVRKWHYQIVHHGLWDYDLASPPVLAPVTVQGRKIDAVVQLTKEGFAFVFDRVTGKPVWPITERPVPPSDVPGEVASATQPIPTAPSPVLTAGRDTGRRIRPDAGTEGRGTGRDEALPHGSAIYAALPAGVADPAGRARRSELGRGGAFDPVSGMLYVKTTNTPALLRIAQTDRSAKNYKPSEMDADRYGETGTRTTFHGGLPLTKPPYGELTAISLNQGTIAWRQPFGDWPELRANPALAGVPLPKSLGASGPCGAIVTQGGLLFAGGGDTQLHAIDKATGTDLWQGRLPGRSGGTPMTYRTRSGRQFVVIAAGDGASAELVAFALPR